jgi:hypothetical protein
MNVPESRYYRQTEAEWSMSKPGHELRNPKADAKDVVRLPENKEMLVNSGTLRLIASPPLILAKAD